MTTPTPSPAPAARCEDCDGYALIYEGFGQRVPCHPLSYMALTGQAKPCPRCTPRERAMADKLVVPPIRGLKCGSTLSLRTEDGLLEATADDLGRWITFDHNDGEFNGAAYRKEIVRLHEWIGAWLEETKP